MNNVVEMKTAIVSDFDLCRTELRRIIEDLATEPEVRIAAIEQLIRLIELKAKGNIDCCFPTRKHDSNY